MRCRPGCSGSERADPWRAARQGVAWSRSRRAGRPGRRAVRMAGLTPQPRAGFARAAQRRGRVRAGVPGRAGRSGRRHHTARCGQRRVVRRLHRLDLRHRRCARTPVASDQRAADCHSDSDEKQFRIHVSPKSALILLSIRGRVRAPVNIPRLGADRRPTGRGLPSDRQQGMHCLASASAVMVTRSTIRSPGRASRIFFDSGVVVRCGSPGGVLHDPIFHSRVLLEHRCLRRRARHFADGVVGLERASGFVP